LQQVIAEGERGCVIERSMANAQDPAGWRAELQLTALKTGAQTVLARSRHVGPLRVQRPFIEASGACQVYVLHPPGGIVGGDTLDVDVRAMQGANVLLTTPGAGKFYRSTGQLAVQRQRLTVEDGASIEWLPQESIVFDGAVGASHSRIDLVGSGKVIWWEVTCLGRPASGERLTQGRFSQSLELFHEARPLLLERTRCVGGERALGAAWGYQGLPVFATFVVHPFPLELLAEVRAVFDSSLGLQEERLGVTLLPTSIGGVASATLACRYLGPSAARAKHLFGAVWERVRPKVIGLDPEPPRVWQT
jgi:urease accessory protein